MKFSIVLLLLIALPAIVLSQDTNTKRTHSSEFYMEKSKNQKTAGWIMLGGGSGMFLIGLALYTDQGLDSGVEVAVLAGAGVVTAFASIPVFISSGYNARRAATISFGHQQPLFPQPTQTHLHFQPALTLKMSISK